MSSFNNTMAQRVQARQRKPVAAQTGVMSGKPALPGSAPAQTPPVAAPPPNAIGGKTMAGTAPQTTPQTIAGIPVGQGAGAGKGLTPGGAAGMAAGAPSLGNTDRSRFGAPGVGAGQNANMPGAVAGQLQFSALANANNIRPGFNAAGQPSQGAAPGATPTTDPMAFYNDLMGQQLADMDQQWANQQGALQGQMAAFDREAMSLNARMGGSIAGGYAGLAGSALGSGMRAYSDAANQYQADRRNTMMSWMDKQLQQGNREQERGWTKEDQDRADAMHAMELELQYPGMGDKALARLRGLSGADGDAVTGASGSGGGSPGSEQWDLNALPAAERMQAKAVHEDYTNAQSAVRSAKQQIAALEAMSNSGSMLDRQKAASQLAAAKKALKKAQEELEATSDAYQQYKVYF